MLRFLSAPLAASPDLALGLACLIVWLAPIPLGPGVVAQITLLMLLEFVIMHSSAIMGSAMFKPGPRRDRIRALLGFAALYSLFVGGFALQFKTVWPLASFWLLSLNRMAGVLLGNAPRGEEQAFIQRSWAASAVFYLMGAFVTVLLPIPRLGLTAAVIAKQDLVGGGLWVDQPHRVVAFGFLYFTAVGLSELRGHEWARQARTERKARRPASDRRAA